MRNIKFRGKSLATGEWLYGSHFNDGAEDYILPNLPSGAVDYEMYQVDQNTIGQFTVLYDKAGKEIYEGDILRAGEEKTLLEVRFVRGVFAFLWNGDLDDEFPCNAPTQEWAEVVGNIHDIPKMIKRK